MEYVTCDDIMNGHMQKYIDMCTVYVRRVISILEIYYNSVVFITSILILI